ncbi:MAG: thioredoxin domain-containing protein, partial [Gammaproteobacteria bacterium]
RGSVEEIGSWHQTCLAEADVRTEVYAVPADAGELPALLAERRAGAGPVAYVCEGMTCRTPIRDEAALADYLKQEGGK